MDFVPSGWKRDLTHMVGCFSVSQIGPLNTRQWYSDRDKFLQAMEDLKGKWLNIKELEPLRYMRYVDKCFVDSTGHGQQLHLCPHRQGVPVPPGPMECPSMFQQQQRSNR